MATLREFLNKTHFDWGSGRILVRRYDEKTDEIISDFIGPDHDLLNMEFDDGWGKAECPEFVAEDMDYIYFPVQYDGKTWASKIAKDISRYQGRSMYMPYFGQ